MAVLVFVLIQLFFAVFIFYLCLSFVIGAPFVPTKTHAAQTMIALSGMKKNAVVYDLGSGDGRLLFLAAQGGAKATGYEINPFLVLYTNIRTLFSPCRRRIHAYWKNFWSADISDADIVFLYLVPWRMERLKAMLEKQLKPGTLVVSNSFIFPGWKILRQDRSAHVYVFRV